MAGACCSTGCPATLDLEPVTALVYGVPKLARGLALDDKPTDEVKADQKEFFGLLYRLLVDAERGPRLPTLVVALGAERVRRRCLGRLTQPSERVGARPGWSRAGTPSSAPTRRSRRWRGRTARAGPGCAGSHGWARAPTAPGRGPSSRCGAAGRGCGGSRRGRRRRRSRRRRPRPGPAAARAAQAAGDAGWRRTTARGRLAAGQLGGRPGPPAGGWGADRPSGRRDSCGPLPDVRQPATGGINVGGRVLTPSWPTQTATRDPRPRREARGRRCSRCASASS